MSIESLFLLLLFVFVALSSVIVPWLRKRIDARMPPEIEPEALEATRRAQVRPPRPAPAPDRSRASDRTREGPMRAPLPAVAPPAALRPQARWPVASLRDARRGIVLMTLLGPCRAMETYDPAAKRSP
jgi:hypothetical protein